MNVCDSSSLKKKKIARRNYCASLFYNLLLIRIIIFFCFQFIFSAIKPFDCKTDGQLFLFCWLEKKIKRTRTNIKKYIKIVMEGHRVHGCCWNLLNDAFLLGRRVYWGEVRCWPTIISSFHYFPLFSSFHTSLSPYQTRRAFKARLVKTQITTTWTHLRGINIHKNTFVQVTRLTIHDSIALVIRQP